MLLLCDQGQLASVRMSQLHCNFLKISGKKAFSAHLQHRRAVSLASIAGPQRIGDWVEEIAVVSLSCEKSCG